MPVRSARTPFHQILLGEVIIAAAVDLALIDDLSDGGIVIIKHLSQQEHRPLDRRQIFHQHHESHRDGFGVFCFSIRGRLLGEDRLRQPRADVLFTLRFGRFELVETQPCDDGRQVGF